MGELLRRCHMIKAAIGDSRIGRVWEEIRGEQPCLKCAVISHCERESNDRCTADRLAARKTGTGDSSKALKLKLEYFRRSEQWTVKDFKKYIFIPTDNDPSCLHILFIQQQWKIYSFTKMKALLCHA